MNYERSLMAKWDEYARNESAIEEGLKKGMKEGLKEGRKEGKYEMGVEVIKNLLTTGKFTIPEIAEYVGVTEDFVRKVKESLN